MSWRQANASERRARPSRSPSIRPSSPAADHHPDRGQLELKNTLGTKTIDGPAAGVTISGGGLSRVFQVDRGVTASFSG